MQQSARAIALIPPYVCNYQEPHLLLFDANTHCYPLELNLNCIAKSTSRNLLLVWFTSHPEKCHLIYYILIPCPNQSLFTTLTQREPWITPSRDTSLPQATLATQTLLYRDSPWIFPAPSRGFASMCWPGESTHRSLTIDCSINSISPTVSSSKFQIVWPLGLLSKHSCLGFQTYWNKPLFQSSRWVNLSLNSETHAGWNQRTVYWNPTINIG